MSAFIRIAAPVDSAHIAAIYGPYCDSSPISFDIVAPTTAQMADRIERILPEYPWLVSEVDGQIAGYVYASRHRERPAYRWDVEVAVYIAPPFQRRGIGRALYTALFEVLREQNLVKAYAGITLPNPGSVGLHEGLGFTQVGVYRGAGYKLGRWLDVGWWELALRPEIPNPPEPRLFGALRESPAVMAAMERGGDLLRGAFAR
jgi:phosphinothricin acetyltransferase